MGDHVRGEKVTKYLKGQEDIVKKTQGINLIKQSLTPRVKDTRERKPGDQSSNDEVEKKLLIVSPAVKANGSCSALTVYILGRLPMMPLLFKTSLSAPLKHKQLKIIAS